MQGEHRGSGVISGYQDPRTPCESLTDLPRSAAQRGDDPIRRGTGERHSRVSTGGSLPRRFRANSCWDELGATIISNPSEAFRGIPDA